MVLFSTPPPLRRAYLDHYTARLHRLTPEHRGQWGELDATTMVAHLRRALVYTMEPGGGPTAKPHPVMSLPPIRWLLLHRLTWPRGKIKVTSKLTAPAEDDFSEEIAKLTATMEAWAEFADANPKKSAPHPMFGVLPITQWCVFHGRHFDHHLTQFAV
ncbi:MAG: DUF1569 domain-containing protein [Sumerlaeia bacterium]